MPLTWKSHAPLIAKKFPFSVLNPAQCMRMLCHTNNSCDCDACRSGKCWIGESLNWRNRLRFALVFYQLVFCCCSIFIPSRCADTDQLQLLDLTYGVIKAY